MLQPGSERDTLPSASQGLTRAPLRTAKQPFGSAQGRPRRLWVPSPRSSRDHRARHSAHRRRPPRAHSASHGFIRAPPRTAQQACGEGEAPVGPTAAAYLRVREDRGGTGNDAFAQARKPLEPDCAARRTRCISGGPHLLSSGPSNHRRQPHSSRVTVDEQRANRQRASLRVLEQHRALACAILAPGPRRGAL